MEDIKVSVIVPIFGVERFISRCVRSLMKQSLREVEFIFVNDATTDASMDRLVEEIDNFQERKASVQIINLEKNEGLPAARNHGLHVARGQYIFHCDSDDFVASDMLENLYNVAVSQDADIVWCDWFLSMERGVRYMRQPSFDKTEDAVRAMLCGAMKFNVWNKLVRRSLYEDNGISFPSGYGMGEDMTMIMLFACAKKVTYLPKAFYYYVKTNTAAFSRTYSERHLKELLYNVHRTDLFIQERYGEEMTQELAFMKLEAKFPLLLLGDESKLELWTAWFPETNVYIMQNKYVPFRNRLLQWCAWKKLWCLVRAYSILFNKVVYGMIFK